MGRKSPLRMWRHQTTTPSGTNHPHAPLSPIAGIPCFPFNFQVVIWLLVEMSKWSKGAHWARGHKKVFPLTDMFLWVNEWVGKILWAQPFWTQLTLEHWGNWIWGSARLRVRFGFWWLKWGTATLWNLSTCFILRTSSISFWATVEKLRAHCQHCYRETTQDRREAA